MTAEGNRHPAGRVRGVGANCSLNNQEKSLGHADDANWTYSGHLRSAITRSRRCGRRQLFVMQAARQRSDAHPEGLADPMAGQWCRGRRDEAGRVGK
jgi:hypothetical protein